jgi:hypothetical protein
MCSNPPSGGQRQSDLSGVFVHKFRLAGQLDPMAHLVDEGEEAVTLLALGSQLRLLRPQHAEHVLPAILVGDAEEITEHHGIVRLSSMGEMDTTQRPE